MKITLKIFWKAGLFDIWFIDLY